MKNVVYKQFGTSDVLETIETDIPKKSPQQVLIQVKAVSINPLDWRIYSGSMKMVSGKKFPKDIGLTFSGTITETGSQVSEFEVGDDVFGAVADHFKDGALAHYIVADTSLVVLKPENISHEQASAIVVGGATALKAFEDKITLQENQEVLINGASGGVGMMAVQIAKKQELL